MARRQDDQGSKKEDPNYQLEGVHNVEESLEILAASIRRIDEELSGFYSNFHVCFHCHAYFSLIFREIA